MRTILAVILAAIAYVSADASRFTYSFDNTPISEAIVRIGKDHPDVNIFFIYKELDHYMTSATIETDDVYRALRRTIGKNPISVIKSGNSYFIEALQHGKFKYTGKVIDLDNEPVIGASVMLLNTRDSTVITYGVSDIYGRFSILCDKKNVLAKFSCIGYKTCYVNPPAFTMGVVAMHSSPIPLAAMSVEADNTILSTDKNVYIPSSRQKNASQDAADLLRRMAIPQLIINPGDNSVKDVFGNNVPIFINYHEAQPDELKGMKMSDVRKVEYFEFPTDPRFKGAERLVNFIVWEYEYGGYTKASEAFRTVNGVFNNAEFFSRFACKKMTYDIYAGSDIRDFHHNGSDNSAVYRLNDNGTPLDVSRTETFKHSHTRSNEYPVTFRASYYSPRFTARNILSFTHYSSPEQFSCGDLSVDIRPKTDCTYSRNTPNRNNTVSYNSNIWGAIGSKASFDISPTFRHTHRNNISAYESTLINDSIVNYITENSYNWSVQANGRTGIGQNSQLSLFLAGGQNINNLTYRGSNNNNDSYSNSFFAGELRYRYQTRKVAVSSFLGFGFDHNSINGVNTNDAFPRFGANAWLSLNKKSQISASISYQTTTPDISMKANDIVQSNEFMYLTANPNLKNWRNLNSNLSFSRYYNNSFSFTAFAGFEQDNDRVATIYQLYNDGMSLLRNYNNDGSYRHYCLGISANYKLFDNCLQLYANLTQNAYEITGEYSTAYYPFRVQLQGVYYWKSFNILASWGNPQRSLTENSNYIIRARNFHLFSIGWGNGTWAVKLEAKNIFNKGWCSETREKNSPLYSELQWIYTPLAHASLSLTVTCTLGYGKKVQRGNEVRSQGSAPSAIIRQ
ncbi:MAG: TonB-dependent receptor [Muribaculaceae bacterium]|nr:TonB-dependent receptor [Muribaculaceae bacterium]